MESSNSNGMSLQKKCVIVGTCVIYVVNLVFNALANVKGQSLFPYATGDVSNIFALPITPSGPTFTIWAVIFVLQLAWMIYIFTTIFDRLTNGRKSSNIITLKFYIFFSCNIILVVGWLLTWSRKLEVASMVLLILTQAAFNASFITASIDIRKFILENDISEKGEKRDVWCHRILVQNGLIFYGTWTTIAMFLNIAVVIGYTDGVGIHSPKNGSIGVVAALMAVVLIWFLLENVVFEPFFRFVFFEFIVLIVASSGALWKNPFETPSNTTSEMLAVLLALASTLLVTRLLVIFVKERARYQRSVTYKGL